jgi:hypothetical protein
MTVECAPTVASRTAAGGNSKRARGPQGGGRSHGQLGWNPLGRTPRRSVRRSSGYTGGNRTASGWLALATFPRPLLRLRHCPAPCDRPQVLPAYSLQDLRNEHRDPKTKSNPNTMCPLITPGGNRGTGHFYLAKNRTFLLCVDTNLVLVLFPLFEATGKAGRSNPVGTTFATMNNQKARPALQPRRAFVLCSLNRFRLQSTSMRCKRIPGWRTFTK